MEDMVGVITWMRKTVCCSKFRSSAISGKTFCGQIDGRTYVRRTDIETGFIRCDMKRSANY